MLVEELPPYLLAGIRFVSAAFIIFSIELLRRNSIKISWTQFKNSLVIGILFLTIGNGAVVWGLKYIDSGFAALLIATQPLILIVMMFFLEKKPILPKSLLGIGLGLLGLYLLVDQDTSSFSVKKWQGILAVFIALLSWGYGSLLIAKIDLPKRVLLKTGYQMLLGGILLFIVSFLRGEEFSAALELSTYGIYSMLFLIIFGSIIAFTSFNYLLEFVSPEKVATSTYVNPIVAMLLGWWVLDEIITGQSLIAAMLLLLGVYFVNSSKNRALKSKSDFKSDY